jgi:hypothetical protein
VLDAAMVGDGETVTHTPVIICHGFGHPEFRIIVPLVTHRTHLSPCPSSMESKPSASLARVRWVCSLPLPSSQPTRSPGLGIAYVAA